MAEKAKKPRMQKKSVLFICLGNICRSPIAEAVFQHLLTERKETDKWDVDSAALGPWHVGNDPDKRAMQTLKKNGLTEYRHTVRQITNADFSAFDYIFGMDEDNISELKKLERKAKSKSTAKIEMLGKYDPEGILIIPDPYYGSKIEDFDQVYSQCYRSCEGFLTSLEKQSETKEESDKS